MSFSAEHSANDRTSASASAHTLGRPGPGEPSGILVVPGRAEGVARRNCLRTVYNLASSHPPPLLRFTGEAKGQSDLGYLPKPYKSPSDSCNHDLGGLKILADKLKDASGKIIGVQSVHVTCSKCKGQPFLKGKSMGMPQPGARNVSIPDYLPAAQALFLRSGAVAVWPEE